MNTWALTPVITVNAVWPAWATPTPTRVRVAMLILPSAVTWVVLVVVGVPSG
jgi:hypothetical protein